MRTYCLALALTFTGFSSIASAQTATSSELPERSATIARDIGGFTLGMRIADVGKIVRIESLGNGNFQAIRDGIIYDFEVTRLGRIYRVASSQNLGRFKVDAAFMKSVAAKLSAKYGPPNERSTATLGWSLIEPVRRSGGQTLPFTTMWASAYVSGGADGVTLEMKMIDFRIMWADDARINQGPRDRAAAAVKL